MIRRAPFRLSAAVAALVAAAPAALAAEVAPAPVAAAALAASQGTLRPLEASVDGWQLDGEADVVATRVFVTAAEAAAGATLDLVLDTAVSVMPEASRLTLFVNGQRLAIAPLGPQGGEPVTMAIPAGVLVAGWNDVRLMASQRHRVDCSLDATFELWTRIDPARSGLRLPGPATVTGLSDLGLLGRDGGGRLPIRLRLYGDDPATAAAGLVAAGAAARLAGTGHPVVEVAADAGTGPGLDVAVGAPEVLAMAGLPSPAGAGARLVDRDGRPTLVVAGSPADGFAAALGDLAAADRRQPPAPWPAGSHAISLADLGLDEFNFSGRRWRQSFMVDLPADALIADYAPVTLSLDGAHAPGLAADAALSIEVDGRLVASASLGNAAGSFFENREIELPLTAFHPGRNVVTLQADLPVAADADCDARAQISGGPRFLLLKSSTLTVPRLARMAELPSLPATLGAGSAGVLGRPVTLALPRRDADSLGAAATLYARLAASAATLPALRILDGEPVGLPADTIVVAARADLSDGLLARMGLPVAALDDAWSRRLDPAGPAVTGSVAGFVGVLPAEAAAPADGGGALLAEWQSVVARNDGPLDRLAAALADLAAPVLALVGEGAEAAPLPVSAATRLVVTQAIADGADGPVTLVTAARPDDLAAGVADLTAPDVWRRLAGGTALLGGKTSPLVTVAPAAPRLVATRPMDFVNLRLATAAWFSRNTAVYVGLVAGVAVLLGLATFALVRRSGVRTAP